MAKDKNHPPYVLLFPILKLSGISHKEMSEYLKCGVRTFRDKTNGYGDFLITEADAIKAYIVKKCPPLTSVVGDIFLTSNVIKKSQIG